MATAWGYARCSTDMQDHSIADQKHEILEYAAAHGFQFIKPAWFIDEGRSGISTEKRTGLQNLITAVEENLHILPDVLLVYDVSRWGRYIDPDEAAYWEYSLKRHGIRVIYTHEDFANDLSMGSTAVKAIKRSAATDFVRRMSITVTRGAKSNAREGYWNGAVAPYGYKRLLLDQDDNPIKVLDEGERKFQQNHRVRLTLGEPHEVEVVKRVYHSYIHRGMGMRAIAQELNTEGIPSPRGGIWNIQMVQRILTNPVYIGVLVWGREKAGKFSRVENTWHDSGPNVSRHDRDKWVVCEDAHEAIVSKEAYELAASLRKQRTRFKPGKGGRTRNSPYLLSGILYCSKCNRKLVGHTDNRGAKKYQYYRDSGFSNSGAATCDYLSFPRAFLDDFALDRIAERLEDPQWLTHIEQGIRNRLSDPLPTEKRNSLEERLKETDEKIERLLDLAELGGGQNLQERLSQRRQEKQAIEQELAHLKQTAVDSDQVDELVAEMMKAFEDVRSVIELGTNDEKKQLTRNFIEKVIVDRDENRVDFHFYRSPLLHSPSFFHALYQSRQSISDVKFHLYNIGINTENGAA